MRKSVHACVCLGRTQEAKKKEKRGGNFRGDSDFRRKAQKSSMKKKDDTVEKRKGKMVKNIRKNDTEEEAENKSDKRDSAAVQPCRTTVSYKYHLTVIDGPNRYISPT